MCVRKQAGMVTLSHRSDFCSKQKNMKAGKRGSVLLSKTM